MRHLDPVRFARILALTLGCLLSLSACGNKHTLAPLHPSDDPEFQAGGVARVGMPDDPPLEMRLRPGDTLTVRTTSNENNEYQGLVIDSASKVHVPMAGAVVVGGLTPAEAEKRLEGVLQKYDRFVSVSVLVTGWGGHYATVLGAVVQEGTVALTPGMRMAELLARAGGPLRSSDADTGVQYVADLDSSSVVRDGKTLPISIRKALQGVPGHNVLVHPGDTIYLPAGLGSRVAVLGDIARGGAMLPFRDGMRLSEALASTGGMTLDADENDIRVIRGPLERPKVYVTSFEAVVEGDGSDIELARGDIVFVTKHWAGTLGNALARIGPAIQLLNTGVNTALLINNLQQARQTQRLIDAQVEALEGGADGDPNTPQ